MSLGKLKLKCESCIKSSGVLSFNYDNFELTLLITIQIFLTNGAMHTLLSLLGLDRGMAWK